VSRCHSVAVAALHLSDPARRGLTVDVRRRTWPDLISAVLNDRAPTDLVAQPILDLGNGEVVGYELLARFGWPLTVDDVSATPPPDRWFAAAADLGLAAALTAQVLRRAFEARPTLPDRTFCTVNVGPEVLPHPLVQAVFDCHQLDGVVVELTEHSPGEPTTELLRHLDELRDRGALIAVDDAGSGYSGLSQVLAVRPDMVKVDRHIVAGLDGDPRRRDMVEALLQLCHRLGGVLLAEGVETFAECEALIRLGVPLGQGWFLGMPAKPWPPPQSEVGPWIGALADQARTEDSVLSLTRPLMPRPGSDPWLVWDANAEPVSMVYRSSGQVVTGPVLAVATTTPVPAALQLALARAEPHRWAPIVVTDPDGLVIGWVDIADVITRVTVPRPRAGGSALGAAT